LIAARQGRAMRRAGAAAVALLLAACAATPAHQRAELAALAAELDGSYDNLAQVQAEQRAGAADPHEPLALTIRRVQAPLVGDQIFVVRESAADDPRRLFSQRVWVLDQDADGHIVHEVYRFAEPERWRAGDENPELFRALLLRDLEPVGGCGVRWSRAAAGFRGINDPATCGVKQDTDRARHREQVLQLDAAGLAYSEREVDAAGVTVRGRDAANPYILRRQPPAER
jgi:CpeT/CpcT family (DUF1001)